MQNTQSLNELAEKLEWLETLYRVNREVTGSLSLETCLKVIIEEVRNLLDVDRASLMLLSSKEDVLKIKVATGLTEDVIKNTRIKVGEGITGWVAKHRQPLLINDLSKDKRFQKKGYKGYSTESLLSIPLIIKGKCFGVLNVNNKKHNKIFDYDDLKILTAFANEAALAVNNARLYTDLVAANTRLRGLDKMKSNFIARVSHELRTPLASMPDLFMQRLTDVCSKCT